MAALSVFVALIAGSSLRPKYSAAELPEPAAWSQATTGSGATGAVGYQLRPQAAARNDHGLLSGATPLSAKPFHSMWMTHDRPAMWPRLPGDHAWPAPPASFTSSARRPGIAVSAWPPSGAARDPLSRFCVARC
ncbi:hypothetical protein MPRM_22800 [Mycobacterium parmense]|uniref:Uncharacterized protein n=1 Tax=Mycobacterium parmense TaxID=185642 RepID=A0A7I7YTF6_9MYCO|nr:hypothetical protein MPRM_22800 [Mycobacterium parmense]